MAREKDVRECSIARTLDVIGDRWTVLAIRELMLGNRRFDAIASRTGAPRDILTTRLRKLEASGLVTREQYQERPPRSEYQLTDLGWSLQPVLTTLRDWGDRHLAGPDGPPAVFVHSCGEVLEPTLVCAHCGEVPDRNSLTQRV
ncbi:winged helix-turn-helix transcriptional regulator [Desertimonas flava]|uniref:winged helix-turn-helix transcriptional regulator n=1 Tax=Desertimonas flava TaxID=2064846 RepID=UPI000E347FC5|nr:helix-turn-helix domain-containing protein [Desertimonas flava]